MLAKIPFNEWSSACSQFSNQHLLLPLYEMCRFTLPACVVRALFENHPRNNYSSHNEKSTDQVGLTAPSFPGRSYPTMNIYVHSPVSVSQTQPKQDSQWVWCWCSGWVVDGWFYRKIITVQQKGINKQINLPICMNLCSFINMDLVRDTTL